MKISKDILNSKLLIELLKGRMEINLNIFTRKSDYDTDFTTTVNAEVRTIARNSGYEFLLKTLEALSVVKNEFDKDLDLGELRFSVLDAGVTIMEYQDYSKEEEIEVLDQFSSGLVNHAIPDLKTELEFLVEPEKYALSRWLPNRR